MRKLYSLVFTLLLAQYSFAQWPANYGGVMLQGFYWNSFEETQWTKLTEQADELSTYFDAIWVPNSAWCTDGQSMGYDPVYWFRHKSTFGQLRDLRTMLSTYKEKGVSFIGDVILNHRKPEGVNGSWIDFPKETFQIPQGGESYTVEWSGADICQNDDGGWVKEQGWPVTGSFDTGDDFSGFRDLDHTSPNVQKNCKLYLRFLLENLGYDGFRLDMVKGYAGEYTKMYNEAVKPKFCVGEYWDGNAQTLINWINSTGRTSAAFDFSLKYAMRDAFGGGNWGALSNKGLAGSPEYSRYSVTFVDNHDTYENQDRLTNNVLAANGLILALPGTPCIFLKHWQRYPVSLSNMILARKACGITNQSPITEQQQVGNGYAVKTQGSKGTVLYLCGTPNYNTSGFKLIVSGTNFAYYVSDNITVSNLRQGTDDEPDVQKNISIYVEADKAPHLYAWTTGNAVCTSPWPGDVMTETATIEGRKFWTRTFSVVPLNIIFNDGNDNKTIDITGLNHDSYFTYDGSKGYQDITDQYYTPEPVELPACVKPIEGHVYAYFMANKDYDTPYAWVWGADSKSFNKNTFWPGDAMKKAGSDGKGHNIYLWDGGEAGSDMPTGILFSNNGTPQTADFTFHNGGYYDATGYIASVTTGIARIVEMNTTSQAPVYNLNGQRVADGYRGLIIQNGRKVMVK